MKPENLLITVEYIRQALDDLIKTPVQERVNPLQFLNLIDEYCLKADFSFFQNPRQFALNEFLASVIREQYRHQRGLHDLPAPQAGVSLATATNMIKEDASVSNPDLLGWAWIYFHYVEDHLHISQQWFCDTVRLDDRTIRRYQKDTINHLLKHLIVLEQEARLNHRKKILSLQLPHHGTITHLMERDREFQIVRNSGLKHFYISGAPGIGKSSFVELCLQESIRHDELDHIMWFERPKNIEYVKLHIQEQLLVENSRVTLAEYLSIKRIAIVLDDCEYLLEEAHPLELFIQEFSRACIFLTSKVFQTMDSCFQINLHELSPYGASILMRQLHGDNERHEDNRYVWQLVGGNPLVIHLLAQNSTVFDLQLATSLTLEQVFLGIYLSLHQNERLAWLILVLLNSNSSLVDLAQFESPYVNADDFINLIRLSIATKVDNARIALTSSACHFIKHFYTSDSEMQFALEGFVKHLSVSQLDNSDSVLSLVEAVLACDWIQLSDDLYPKFTKLHFREGILRGHFATWHSILSQYAENVDTATAELAIGYGLCQRHLGQWAEAQSVFAKIIQFAGSTGDFEHQGEALLELAILMRWQGNYNGALESLRHLEILVKSKHLNLIRNRLIIEQVELALEQNQPEAAWALVNQLQVFEVRKQVLIIEICSREHVSQFSYATIQKWVLDLLSHYENHTSIRARLHILMGRISEKQNDIDFAIKHLRIALSLLTDQDNDPFALGRTQTNLAGALIKVNQLTDAQMLINSAKSIQQKISDRVGLAATLHNERAIHRKLVN